MKLLKSLNPKTLYYLAWLQAVVATLTSLYFSEILKWPPCLLCWYQRIFMYPLVILIPMGIMFKDNHLPKYILGLAFPGALLAAYHYLLQQGVIESVTSCTSGVSCETDYLAIFGIITIPLLSFIGFVFIALLAYVGYRNQTGTPSSN